PDAIHKTERDTYVFPLDGEQQIYPSFSAAARALGKTLGLGTKHVSPEEIRDRVGPIPVTYRQLHFNARDLATPPPGRTAPELLAAGARTLLDEAPETPPPQEAIDRRRRLEITPEAPVPRRGGGSRKQQRSIKVELPSTVLRELMRGGRARVLLSVK